MFASQFRKHLLVAALLALLVVGTTVAAPGFRVVQSHGIRLTLPAGWAPLPPASAGAVFDPKTLLVVGTHGVKARSSHCQIAAYRIPVAGAVVVVVGWDSLKYSGAKGAIQGRAPLAKLVRVRHPSFECFNGRGAAADLVLKGKAYQVNVMVGVRASPRVIEQALAVGRSFNLSR
ncbi:MAG: hypothetical protein H0X39_02430 [Actinobacteria bacterium]|nr:hypothetical protein [Actinomycetota bacterium]